MILRSIVHYTYLKLNLMLPNYNNISNIEQKNAIWSNNDINSNFPKVAFLCDEMTWQDFKEFTNAIFLHPRLWKEQLEYFKPDMFFCESAWSGIDLFKDIWRARVYKDNRIIFDNRKELLEILDYCKKNNIITVFWSKEDPTYFNHIVYDFTKTSLNFDIILTTAEECIKKYNNMGHKNVFLFPFGINTYQYNNNNYNPIENSAIFAGSWFNDQLERCSKLEKLLDYAISQNWKLDIYDRKSNSNAQRFKFPQKYNSFIHEAKSYIEIPSLLKKYQYALNVNTVTKSKSMCSRRLLQLISTGNTVVTNWSNVIENLLYYDYITIDDIIDNDIYILKGKSSLITSEYSTEFIFKNLCNKLNLV